MRILVAICCLIWLAVPCVADDLPTLEPLDDALQISLFARDPEIVTPIGIAVDRRNRVFVVESHTHMPDKNYPGPKHDRIRMLVDTTGDSQADRVTTFASGLKDGMNLTFSPDGELYVCHRTGVVVLHDRDGDGVSEARTEILKLETKQTYSHNGLLGVKFGTDGWVYVSRGNLGGYAYTLRGTDGVALSGYRDGGNLVRCRPDGTGLEEVATGFWNPFDMDFDRHGRLLLADNDPDSRGPNRLLHIVHGGDYGFRSHYGPSGLHPFQAWDGELPGTLPMIAGTGEAPSGVFACDRAALPPCYRDSLLVTSWGDHTIERFALVPRGVSLASKREVFVRGGSSFRPVGIAAGPDGAIYVTDWVRKDYPSHGEGRIWKITAKPDVELLRPRHPFDPPRSDAANDRLARVLELNSVEDVFTLLGDDDPFLRAAAVNSLAKTADATQLLNALRNKQPATRLGALLALRWAGHPASDGQLQRLLADEACEVRAAALLWTVELGRKSLVTDLDRALAVEPVSADLLRMFLAAKQAFSPREWTAYEQRKPGFNISRELDQTLVDSLALDSSKPSWVTALALGMVREPDRPPILERLLNLAAADDLALRREAVRTLAGGANPRIAAALREIAHDQQSPAQLRADAVQAMKGRSPELLRGLVPLLDTAPSPVQIEIVRTLRPLTMADRLVRAALEAKLAELNHPAGDQELREQLQFALFPPAEAPGGTAASVSARPQSVSQWIAALAAGGDPETGRRVFFDPGLKCANCHRLGGRGGGVGPDLSLIGRSSDRRRLVQSILRPSDDVAPQFQVHVVETVDGRVFAGIQFHFRDGGRGASLMLEDGREVRFPLDQLENWKASEKSLMPDGLERQMTVSDFRHLVAFLESLK